MTDLDDLERWKNVTWYVIHDQFGYVTDISRKDYTVGSGSDPMVFKTINEAREALRKVNSRHAEIEERKNSDMGRGRIVQ